MTGFVSSDSLDNLTNLYNRPITIQGALRVPTANDIYAPNTSWVYAAVSPAVIYTTSGNGTWTVGDVALATTTTAGTVVLDTYAALAAGTANGSVPLGSDVYTYVNSVATAGAPVATTTTQGISTLATDAKAVAGTPSTGLVALAVQPSNLAAVFAANPAIGGTTPAAAVVTTLGFTTATGTAGGTWASGGTAISIGADAAANTIAIGNGAAATVVAVGSATGAATLTLKAGATGRFSLDGGAATTYAMGASTTTGTITIGGSAQSTGAITVGNSSATNTLNLGIGNGINTTNISTGVGGNTIHIGDGAGTNIITIGNGASINTVSLGSTTTSSATTINGGSGGINLTGANVKIATTGKGLQIKAGAATDMAGTSVLTLGTVTVSNTNIATGDLILLQRIATNGSVTTGEFTYTISNGASFTVTSVILGVPGSTQTADVSSFAYFVVRPV